MSRDALSRRDFHKLSAAALGGLIAGAAVGCGEQPGTKPASPTNTGASPSGSQAGAGSSTSTASAPPNSEAKGATVAATAVALHACRGLNECKQQGKDHKNSCVGQGNCYTVSHSCSGKNDCKYQGGCGGENGQNDCKGKGGCGHFPIADEDVWKKARAAFEGRMKKTGKAVGAAPAAAAG